MDVPVREDHHPDDQQERQRQQEQLALIRRQAELEPQEERAEVREGGEDKVDEHGVLSGPFFKPDWCPDSFLSRMYVCHLTVLRRGLVEALGRFRTEYEGGHVYDLVLRLTERSDRILHIPKILYHWRIHSDSTARDPAVKPWVYEADHRALQRAIDRRGQPGQVVPVPGFPGFYIVRYQIRQYDKVSIIIPTRDHAELLDKCLASVFAKSTYPDFEVILIDNGSVEPPTAQLIATWTKREPERLRCIRLDIPFNFSRLCNHGVAHARGTYLLFLNNDTEVITPDWIDGMVEQAQRPAIGAVGALLIYADGSIQHAGAILGLGGLAAHSHRGCSSESPGYAGQVISINNYLSVAGACLMCRRTVFDEVGRFLEDLPSGYEDVDLCFSIRSLGFKTIYQPKSAVIHYRGGTAGTDTRNGFKRYQEINRKKFREKWRDVLTREHFDKGSTNPEIAAEKRRGPRIVVSDGMYLSPNHDAGSLRMATILEILAKRSRPVFVTVRSRLSPDSESLLEKVGVEVIYVRDFRLHPVDYENVLKQIGFDVAILSRPTTATALLPLIRQNKPEARIIYDTVDVHFRRLQREYEMTGDASIAEQAIQKREEEAQLASLSDQVWCVTEDDKRALQSEAQDVNIAIIPTIHALRGRGKTFDERRDLVFIGNFNHRPNTDAVHFFVREIFPLVRAALPGVKLYLAGSNTTDEISAYQSEAIVVN